MILLVFCLLLPSFVLTEPMLYMYPSNPQLHPSGMYPNQQFSRGKVKGLPDAGVIYLNRIKPMNQEFLNLKTSSEIDSPNIEQNIDHSSFEKYSSEEERRSKSSDSVAVSIPIKSASKIQKFDAPKVSTIKQEKNVGNSAIMETSDISVPEEEELDRLLKELIESEGKSKRVAGLPKIARSSSQVQTSVKSKLIKFDGTARMQHSSDVFQPKKSAVNIRLKPTKLYKNPTSKSRNEHDYDPWERIGQ